MAVQAVSGPSWNELLTVRGSGRVRTEGAQFRPPTRIAAADAVQPPESDQVRNMSQWEIGLAPALETRQRRQSAGRDLRFVEPGPDELHRSRKPLRQFGVDSIQELDRLPHWRVRRRATCVEKQGPFAPRFGD